MNDQEAKLFLQQMRNVSKNETQSNTKTCIKTTPAYVISVNGQMATVRLVTDLTGKNPFNVPIITSQTISPGDYVNLAYWDNLSTAVIFSGGNNYPICPNIPIRPNLIDNAYFVGGGTGWGSYPVNQRGQAEYSGVAPLFDRWKNSFGNGGSITLTQNGVTFTGANPYLAIRQVLKCALPIGETYSLSILLHNKSFYTQVITVPTKNEYSQPLLIGNSVLRLLGPDLFELIVFNGDTIPEVVLIKLEPGKTQTAAYQTSNGTWAMLPQNLDYQQELAKCQAYYWEGDNLCFHAYRAAGYNAVIQVPLPGPMRVDSPAVTISGMLISSTGASEAITPIKTYGATSGILMVETTVSTLNGTFIGNAQVTSIAVNAEL